MVEIPPVMYTEVELESYLPAGWVLAEGASGEWDEKKKAFRVEVLDGSDLDWELEIPKKEVDEHGRIEALQRAVDRLYRKRFKTFI